MQLTIFVWLEDDDQRRSYVFRRCLPLWKKGDKGFSGQYGNFKVLGVMLCNS